MKARIKINARTIFMPQVEPGMLIVNKETQKVFMIIIYKRPFCDLFSLSDLIKWSIDENEFKKYYLFQGTIQLEQ
jgi:hypothetical protein